MVHCALSLWKYLNALQPFRPPVLCCCCTPRTDFTHETLRTKYFILLMVGYIMIFVLSIFATCPQLLRRAKGSNLSVSETGAAGDDSLVYGGAFRQELLLVHPDVTVEPLGAVEAVQYHGITVDVCEYVHVFHSERN
ncbi:unnamed protein product [Ascophyllum nodosum]